MKFNNPYWSEKTKIELLQKWILIHSIIYYKLNTTVVSDQVYDNNSKQLVQLKNSNPDDFNNSKWYKQFVNFEGSTGFDLFAKLNKKQKSQLMDIAEYVVQLHTKRSG